MTAKRYFVTCEVGDCICELISRKLSDDEFEHLTYQNITDRLNQLTKENEQLLKEKIDVEVKLYSANEKILMQMDYDEIIKQNAKNEMEIINLKQENKQLKTTIQQLTNDNTKQKKKLNTTMKENEQLKIALKDKENLISICEKKFKELGYLITCDDDGYVIE